MHVGNKFSLGKIPIERELTAVWWRVPPWLVGTWRNAGKVNRLFVKDFQNPEKNEGFMPIDVEYPDREIIGYQKDKEGRVWTCAPTPYLSRTRQKETANVNIIRSAVPVAVSDKEVILKFLATTLILNKSTRRIISVTQRESFQTYRPIDAGHVLVLSSTEYYDEQGKPTHESSVLSRCYLEEPYKEMPYLPAPGSIYTLIDVRKSFDNFLRDNNMEELTPDRPPMPPPGFNTITF